MDYASSAFVAPTGLSTTSKPHLRSGFCSHRIVQPSPCSQSTVFMIRRSTSKFPVRTPDGGKSRQGASASEDITTDGSSNTSAHNTSGQAGSQTSIHGLEYQTLSKEEAKTKRFPKPPTHFRIPIFGFIVEALLGINRQEDLAKRYGDMYSTDFIGSTLHIVTKREAIEEILKDNITFVSNGAYPDSFRGLFGENAMFVLDPPKHTLVRGSVASAFAPQVFPHYFESFRRRASRTWTNVEKLLETQSSVKLDPILRQNYLGGIVTITTGLELEGEDADMVRNQMYEAEKGMFLPQFGPPWKKAIENRDLLQERFSKLARKMLTEDGDVIEKLREYGDKLQIKGRKDIELGQVNVLLLALAASDLKTGPGHTYAAEEIDDFIKLVLLLWFAGYATSATTTSSAVFELGFDDAIQDQLAAEQDELVRAAGSEELTYEQVNSEMPLLDSYVLEMTRLRPAASTIFRRAATDVELLGYKLKQDSLIGLDLLSTMRDPKWYEDPDSIQVDRFMKQEGRPEAPRVVSFGGNGSPHYCLGTALARMMMKTTLATMLRRYRVKLDPTQSRAYNVIPENAPKSKVVVTELKKRTSLAE